MSDEIHTRRLIVREENTEEQHALRMSQIRLEKEMGRLIEQVEGMRDQMLSVDDLKDLRQFLSNRRAYAAATSALKGAAIWIVAIAAGVSVMWGGFAEAVKAAFHAGAAK
jgi:hypothetical protein